MTPQQSGGSFAPPLTDAKLAEYKRLAEALSPSPIRDAMTRLLACCSQWWELPESAGTPTRPHASGTGTIVMLSPGNQATLFDHIPWREELDMFGTLFDTLPTGTRELKDSAIEIAPDGSTRTLRFGIDQFEYLHDEATGRVSPKPGYRYTRTEVVDAKAKALRDAAHHLLWHAVELCNDREPITSDKLGI